MVVHNDVAELYWNVLGDGFEETITDFQVKIHLPGEDSDVRIWTHGPLTGENKIIDSKTLFFQDKNVDSYTAETVRVMFDKDLVPLATKKSNVDGRENILKYEAAMADTANSQRENEKLELENRANQAVIDLEENQRIYYYNRALELVNELEDDSEQKQSFLDRIEKTKEAVNEEWKESLQYSVECLTEDNYRFLSQGRLEDFKEEIEEGFDEETKQEYLKIYKKLEQRLEIKQAKIRRNFTTIVIVLYVALAMIVLYELIKIIKERKTFKEHYYRDFPNNDNPNVLEYLMKRKSTNLGFSATILNLIVKKVITYEKEAKDGEIILVLKDKNYVGTQAEIVVLNVLFNMVGKDFKCPISSLKDYGKTTNKAKLLIAAMKRFKRETKAEAETKQYFEKSGVSTVFEILIIINYVFSLFITFGVFFGLKNNGLQILWYFLGVTIISILYFGIVSADKCRTQKGKEEFSKWLAHKRFLKDFSRFDKKELPEITLWEKYLVTATVLGCADKVENQMKMYITDTSDINTNLLIYQSVNLNLTRELNRSVRTAMSTSSSTISRSSYSSGRRIWRRFFWIWRTAEAGGGGGGRF